MALTSFFHHLLVQFGELLAWFACRERGLRAETAFWDKWLRTKGDQWGADYQARISPDTYVGEWHGRILDGMLGDEIRVLDVGAGPITSFGYRHKEKKIQIVPVDPLAHHYEVLTEKYGVVPPIKTLNCLGEKLHTCFRNDEFDLVNARNSLDHTVDPVQCVWSMYAVCRVNGYITLIHAENEGQNNKYFGLHQWDFKVANGKLHIQGESYCKCIDCEFAGKIEWCHEVSGGIIHSAGRKIR